MSRAYYAYWRAYGKATNQRKYEGGLDVPASAGNSLSIKGQLNGSDTCEICKRKVSVELHLSSVDGATDRTTGKPAKVFDSSDPIASITVSGTKCSEEEI